MDLEELRDLLLELEEEDGHVAPWSVELPSPANHSFVKVIDGNGVLMLHHEASLDYEAHAERLIVEIRNHLPTIIQLLDDAIERGE